MQLGRIGIWSVELRFGESAQIREAAAELEELGAGTLWIPGGTGSGDVFDDVARLLDATRGAVVATGVIPIWMQPPEIVAAGFHRLDERSPNRVLLGLGVSHQRLVESADHVYERPLRKMQQYLADLDGAMPPVPADARVLGALGPRMLELAAQRAAGAHPYLVTPEYTLHARGVLGPSALLAPAQKVILETDAAVAREIARAVLAVYLALPNYRSNLARMGFDESDLTDGGSDRLVDELFAWGDPERVAGRVGEHLAAGADHVCVEVLADPSANLRTALPRTLPRLAWRRLLEALSDHSGTLTAADGTGLEPGGRADSTTMSAPAGAAAGTPQHHTTATQHNGNTATQQHEEV